MRLSFGESGGKPEINEFDLSIFSSDNIIRFNVSVRYSERVKVRHSFNDFGAYHSFVILGKAVGVVPDKLLQCLCSNHELKKKMNLCYF